LGCFSVHGLNRVPMPAAKIIAFIIFLFMGPSPFRQNNCNHSYNTMF
jgi:hypothetical protein